MKTLSFILRKENPDGSEASPDGISLVDLRDFTAQVATFLGLGRDANKVETQIKHGSFVVQTDLRQIEDVMVGEIMETVISANRQDLSNISRPRLEVLKNWQKRAQAKDYAISIKGAPGGDFLINHQTPAFLANYQPTVVVEELQRYGIVTDLGGTTSPNVHVVFDGEKKQTTISASQEKLREIEGNPLFKRSLIHFVGELQLETQTLRNHKLIDIQTPNLSTFDSWLEKLTKNGQENWKDVPDAASWVRGIRGDEEDEMEKATRGKN